MRKAMVLGVVGLAGMLASPAFADEFSGFRFTINMSQDKLEGELFFNPFLADAELNSNRFGYGFGGGWALNKWLAFEGALKGGGEFNQTVFQSLMAAPEDFVVSHTDIKGLEASVVGSIWIGNNFAFFGRAGMFGWLGEQTVSMGNHETETRAKSKVSASVDDKGFEPIVGLGIQTELDGALMRLEYKYMEMADLGLAGAFNTHDQTVESVEFSIVWTIR